MSTATIARTRKLGELATTVLRHAKKLPEGGIVSPKEFLHLGTRANVDQVLSRLARKGLLLRIGRGMYTVPLKSRFGIRPPSSRSVIEAISHRTAESIVPIGASAATVLGLSTQVPMQEIYLTSGPSRTINLGSRRIKLRHAPLWQVREGVAGTAIRALLSMGEVNAEESLCSLWPRLSASEKKRLVASRGSGPSWLAAAISKHVVSLEESTAA